VVPPSARPAGATPSDEDTAGRVQAGRRSDETRSTPKPHSDLLALARRSASYGNPSVLRANAGISAETGRLTTHEANRNRSLAYSLLALFNSLRKTTSVASPHLSDDVWALAGGSNRLSES
jgi:hypothetical protein